MHSPDSFPGSPCVGAMCSQMVQFQAISEEADFLRVEHEEKTSRTVALLDSVIQS